MMKITVPTPQNRFNSAQTIVYWMPFALFGETPDLFVVGDADPWYCSSTLAHGLMHWNNPSKMPVSSKPKKLAEFITFHISDDIDIGSDVEEVSEVSESEVETLGTMLAKTNALKVVLNNAPIDSNSPGMGSSSSPSLGGSSSSALSFSGQPAKVSPLGKNATTTLATSSKPIEEPKNKNSQQVPKSKKPKRKRSTEEDDSDSDADQDLEDDEAEGVAKALNQASRQNKKEKKAKKAAAKNKNALGKSNKSEGSGIPPTQIILMYIY
jgi:hypothetical protein